MEATSLAVWIVSRWMTRQTPVSTLSRFVAAAAAVNVTNGTSPFPQERDAVYFAGYDANKVGAHDTAWIMRSAIAGAIGITWPH